MYMFGMAAYVGYVKYYTWDSSHRVKDGIKNKYES